MKKFIILTVILTLVIFYTGCSGKSGKTGEENLTTDKSREISDAETDKKEIEEDDKDVQPDRSGEQGETGGEQGETGGETGEETGQGGEAASTETKETQNRQPEPDDEGFITALDGDVDIIRDDESLEHEVEVDFGIQNYDVVSTGDNSMVEIEVTSERCPDTLLTVTENTTFSFEINKLDNTNATSIDIMGGGISMKVGAMANDQDFEVNTGEINMGVRGTAFSVTLLATGDTLVTCETGEVECKDNTGKILFAKPGKVVEKPSGEKIKEVSIALKNVDEYREEWLKNKQKSLMGGNILPQIKAYVKQYEKYIDQFNDAYDNLVKKQKKIIDKWIDQDNKGETGSPADLLKETGTMASYVGKVRGILKVFEHVYYRLEQLKKLHDKGQGVGEIRAGYTTTQFFSDFTKAKIDKKLKKLKYVIKLFSKRNKGSVPIEKVIESLKGDSDDDSSSKIDSFLGD